MEKRPVAYQLYSARDEVEKDLDCVLKSVKEMGYDGVEFAGFFDHSADEIKSLLEKHSLIAISSHVPFQNILKDMFGVIAYHQTIGCQYIAVPYLDDTTRPGGPGFAKALREMVRFARLVKEAGMTLLYHNHDFEFINVSGMYGLDFLYEAVPADLIQSEIDVCWVKYAGIDPAQYLNKYAGRIPVVHLKDYVGRKGESTPYALIGLDEGEKAKTTDTTAFSFMPVGYGCQDVKAVVEAGIRGGAQWFVVEQDMSTDMPPLEAAKLSIETLKKIGLK